MRTDRAGRPDYMGEKTVLINMRESNAMQTDDQNNDVARNAPMMWEIPTPCNCCTSYSWYCTLFGYLWTFWETKLRTKDLEHSSKQILAWLFKLYVLTLQCITAIFLTWFYAKRFRSSMVSYLSIFTYGDISIASLEKCIVLKDKITKRF